MLLELGDKKTIQSLEHGEERDLRIITGFSLQHGLEIRWWSEVTK
jgi:hypothetical protein